MAWSKQGGEYQRPKKVPELPSRRRRQLVVLSACGNPGCDRAHAWKSPGLSEEGSALHTTPGCCTMCINAIRSAQRADKRRQKVANYLAWRQAIKEAS